jgi:ribose 5-phosphate isomerase B
VKIAIAADHGGVDLKVALHGWLRAAGHEVTDLGTNDASSVDYPDYAHRAANLIEQNLVERAILVCGTGVGMAMSANRHRGVRAVNCSDVFTARMSREHNDANILSLGARVVGVGLAQEIVFAFLNGMFEAGRHVGRVAKIEAP